jgi:long-subunit acyl-CoA synthetase (AMP-forming)
VSTDPNPNATTQGCTWAEFAGLARSAAKGLIALGFEPHAKTCILSNTRLVLLAPLVVSRVCLMTRHDTHITAHDAHNVDDK